MPMLNNNMSSLDDPKGIESTLKRYDDEYEELQLHMQKEEGENRNRLKAVSDKIRHAFILAKENEAQKKQSLDNMNDFIRQKDGGMRKFQADGFVSLSSCVFKRWWFSLLYIDKEFLYISLTVCP